MHRLFDAAAVGDPSGPTPRRMGCTVRRAESSAGAEVGRDGQSETGHRIHRGGGRHGPGGGRRGCVGGVGDHPGRRGALRQCAALGGAGRRHAVAALSPRPGADEGRGRNSPSGARDLRPRGGDLRAAGHLRGRAARMARPGGAREGAPYRPDTRGPRRAGARHPLGGRLGQPAHRPQPLRGRGDWSPARGPRAAAGRRRCARGSAGGPGRRAGGGVAAPGGGPGAPGGRAEPRPRGVQEQGARGLRRPSGPRPSHAAGADPRPGESHRARSPGRVGRPAGGPDCRGSLADVRRHRGDARVLEDPAGCRADGARSGPW